MSDKSASRAIVLHRDKANNRWVYTEQLLTVGKLSTLTFDLDSREKIFTAALAPPAAAMCVALSPGLNAILHTSAGGVSSTAFVSFVVRSHTRITESNADDATNPLGSHATVITPSE
eukprot:174473-Prorocentrum_minimum.AAC.5